MFFSVVVPVYNSEKYLAECVDSVLRQSYADFELILVDDGSKDGSGALCDAYAQADARVKVIYKENGGQSTARNAGIRAATGKYAVFLDSDDFIDSDDFFAELHDALENGADVAVFRYYKYFSPEKKSDCGVSLAGVTFESKGQFLAELVKRDAFFCSCWSKCTKMALLKENDIQFDEALRCEDMDWYYRVVSAAQSFTVLDKPYINYRQRENSVTSAFNPRSISDYVITIEKWYARLDQTEDPLEREALLSSLAKLYCNLLISYARNSGKVKAMKKPIFAFKKLLSYQMNPRTRLIGKFNRLFGLNLTCLALKVLDKVKS
ncbi:MAG: glycosyltransferase [Oscillospiraceae bacterium]|nr:glycosyltransferase [Oscillospiraceae bacterium]